MLVLQVLANISGAASPREATPKTATRDDQKLPGVVDTAHPSVTTMPPPHDVPEPIKARKNGIAGLPTEVASVAAASQPMEQGPSSEGVEAVAGMLQEMQVTVGSEDRWLDTDPAPAVGEAGRGEGGGGVGGGGGKGGGASEPTVVHTEPGRGVAGALEYPGGGGRGIVQLTGRGASEGGVDSTDVGDQEMQVQVLEAEEASQYLSEALLNVFNR